MNRIMEPPPILPDIDEELMQYLNPENLPMHQFENNQVMWPRVPNPLELLHFEGSPLCTRIKVERDYDTGEIVDFKEVSVQNPGATAKNSMTLNRAPGPPSDTTKGNATFIPFLPASFENLPLDLPQPEIPANELLTVPPGFTHGLVFAKDGFTVIDNPEDTDEKPILEEPKNVIDIMELVQKDQSLLSFWDNKKEDKQEETTSKDDEDLSEEEEELFKEDPPDTGEEAAALAKKVDVLKISTVSPQITWRGSEWAILLDTTKPVKNFKERIPEMAIKFPFELDTFQKLAILQLEQHNHVFVAAHTSAGKTVVAEYAIALSQRHMTKTIYTSPIKALSNQKYRDFKSVFKDVGLITGDFQINQTASCLIMTTEILRSMLYCGSDITRDLEYVIFDEVHYINDRERGHVWEQVLIMLPAHVCVVLLSATVPNTIEFADWLGRTHQKKVYVVTTYQRPVPLQHYLYTGTGGGSRDNRFKILDADQWLVGGYMKAKETIKPDPQKSMYHKMTPAQERNLWSGLVDHLKRNDLLPVVAFTFSRQKCDNNSSNLTNLDLTTQKEKSHITMFFNRCIRCLKEPDQNIPQIIKMQDILTRGIGVHHSGILPIIKEIVEMLFQRGLIKLLFATETFAMGVNMPARTVVFDAVRKHDGKELRDLVPAEYIQMAGRAGRRGLDTEGTVIILCKFALPAEENLKKMMLSKPSSLVSQFRLTYGMVLSLLRVESLTVEGMMSRSFGEADHQKNMADIKKQLEQVDQQMEELSRQQISTYLQPLVKFYDRTSAYLQIRKDIMNSVMMSPKVQKTVTPGRFLMITYKNHVNKLALLLHANTRSKQPQYKMLVLTDANNAKTEELKEDLWYYMLGLAQDKLFSPVGTPGHEMLTVSPLDVFEISSKTLKINCEYVIRDVEKRQMERFKNDPPGQTCVQAVQELHKLTLLANGSTGTTSKLEHLHYIVDLKVNDPDLYRSLMSMYDLKDKIIDYLPSTQIPNFEQQFSTVFTRQFLEEQKKNLEFKLSNASLLLYPDYENRIALLKQLNYVDHQNRVQLKGRVACEMGMNELLITEIVLRNILTRLRAPEVAALLSALVFRVKSRNDVTEDDSLPVGLRKAIAELKDIHNELANLELSLGIQTDEFQEDLNFGLVDVVYEWASSRPFAEIMQLTEIQEGIIVRCIQQLNETICDVRDAARIIGDPDLQAKMEEASAAIKRDIVFAASLYTHDENI